MAALLFCHGVFGYAHAVGGGMDVHATHAAPMELHHASPDQEPGVASHHAAATGGYFAVLASMLVGALFWARSRSFRMPVGLATRRVERRPAVPVVPYPPRGPTLYILQVIRL